MVSRVYNIYENQPRTIGIIAREIARLDQQRNQAEPGLGQAIGVERRPERADVGPSMYKTNIQYRHWHINWGSLRVGERGHAIEARDLDEQPVIDSCMNVREGMDETEGRHRGKNREKVCEFHSTVADERSQEKLMALVLRRDLLYIHPVNLGVGLEHRPWLRVYSSIQSFGGPTAYRRALLAAYKPHYLFGLFHSRASPVCPSASKIIVNLKSPPTFLCPSPAVFLTHS
jgi:hypothetical protein